MTAKEQPEEQIWKCKIGGLAELPDGADWPMRVAVADAFKKVTGKDAQFCFSGWSATLTEPERAVVENRLPNEQQNAAPQALGKQNGVPGSFPDSSLSLPAGAAPDVAARVKDYPNLYMMLHGAVSGHYTEWPLMRKELTALIEKLGQRWIPVEERLPQDDHHVLVASSWDICSYTAYLRDGKWKHACGDGSPRYEIRSVTHWMPLLSPPERPGE